MIIHPDGKGGHDWLFISTMKCATNSMYKLLPDIGGHRLWNTSGNFHARPTGRLAAVHFTIVRNPYDRAVSIWASTCLRDNDRYGAVAKIKSEGGNPGSFEDFCAACLAPPPMSWAQNSWLFENQSEWIRSFMVDELVHLENLKEELEEIVGPVPKLPVENPSSHRPFAEYLTIGSVDIINDWAADDFQLGDYDKMIPSYKDSWEGFSCG